MAAKKAAQYEFVVTNKKTGARRFSRVYGTSVKATPRTEARLADVTTVDVAKAGVSVPKTTKKSDG